MDNFEVMDDKDSSASIEFDLYENNSHDATLRQGELKSYAVKEDGSAIFAKKKSDYSVTVERLLWVDGWEETITRQGKDTIRKQEMTLVVLKLVLASKDRDNKIRQVTASLAFEDGNPKETNGMNEPQAEAWAPFHKPERWHESVAQRKRTTKTEFSAKAEYSGSGSSATYSKEGEISWNQTAFDEGLANPEISSLTGRRNGVTWDLTQNNLESQGVSREFWAAVLFSRRSRDAYLVRFKIDIYAGTLEEFKDKTKRFFGLKPEQTKAFLVTPWKKSVRNFEGEDIFKSIDVNNLGKLRKQGDRSCLDVKWGPNYTYQAQTSKLAATATMNNESDTIAIETEKVEEDAEKVRHAEDSHSALPQGDPPLVAPSSIAATHQPFSAERPNPNPTPAPGPASATILSSVQPHSVLTQPDSSSQVPHLAAGLPPLLVGWCSPASTVDVGRLTALEARTAQAESRLATQDLTILDLRKALMARDAQLAALEQTLKTLTGNNAGSNL